MNLILFLKGMLMGICDLVPGISGGTIAFITGIYERLINAVNNISWNITKEILLHLNVFKHAHRTKLNECLQKMDIMFLIVLGAGIITSVLLGSKAVLYLLNNYFAYTISFFIGLIIASSKVIHENIEQHSKKNIILGITGIITGGMFAILIPVEVTPSIFYVFIGGFVAISAMFLPGISGSFILLIMGIYKFMLEVLHNLKEKFLYFLVFMAGAVSGMLLISKLIAFMFRKDKSAILSFLLGLVIGSLSIPVKKVATTAMWEAGAIVIMIGLTLSGMFIVLWINSASRKRV